jgi:hypothetical protein
LGDPARQRNSLFKTTDGGRPDALNAPPGSTTGRIGVDLCRRSLHLYLCRATHAGHRWPADASAAGQRSIVGAGVYRSDDAGASWRISPGMGRGGTCGWIRPDPRH